MIELADARIHIDAPQQRVFELFTTEAGICSWMAKVASIDLRPGGRWRWVHDNDVAASGEYLEIDPHDRVVFSYGWESGPYADVPSGSTRVEVTFTPAAAGTDVQVRHHALPAQHREAHRAGWTYFLGLLADRVGERSLPSVRLPRSGGDPSARPTDPVN